MSRVAVSREAGGQRREKEGAAKPKGKAKAKASSGEAPGDSSDTTGVPPIGARLPGPCQNPAYIPSPEFCNGIDDD